MATCTKTPAGNWKVVVRKQGWPTKSKTFRVKRDATDWARRVEDEMVRGVFIDRANSHRQKVSVALDRYLAEVTPTKKSSTAVREKRRAKILRQYLGDYSLTALTPELIGKYRDERIQEGKSASTVRLELALLSHLFTIAIREWRLGLIGNPVAMVRKPAPAPGRDRRLKSAEEKRLLKACDKQSNPMLGCIVRLAIHTGMRQGEIESLTRDQVNLKRRTIKLTDTKNGSARTVPLSKDAAKVLKSALDNPVRPIDTKLIFFGEPGRDGKRRPYVFKPAWFKAIRSAKISGLRFHDLRHEAVSRFVEAGLGDQEVAAISGHKSMQMLKRYTHLRAEDLVLKLDQMNGH
ncbi:MAG: site-specific integrase [Pseudomonadota bacterium]